MSNTANTANTAATISNQENTSEVAVDICDGIDERKVDYKLFITNLWTYLMNYYPNGPRPYYKAEIIKQMLYKVGDIMEKEPVVTEIKSPATIIGPIHGQGDSLATLLSLAGFPPARNYIFLGCYTGMGFAPIESLFLVLCLKCAYPRKIILLKGHLEEIASLKELGLSGWLYTRGIEGKERREQLISLMGKTLAQMPIACRLDTKILCMSGGPGPKIRAKTLLELNLIKKPPHTEKERELFMEAVWSILKIPRKTPSGDGIPTFTEEHISKYCSDNGITVFIRGRQMVDEGFLNFPKEVITLLSAVAYLDNFRNYAAALNVHGNKIQVIRYRMDEGDEPKSLDILKPGIGRNTLA